MSKDKKHRILVKVTSIITFRDISEFEYNDGHLTFIDTKTGQIKRFPTQDCVIEEER